MTAEELKNALNNYHHIYKWWEINNLQYLAILTSLEGVKGIRFDKQVGSPSATNRDPQKLSLIEKKDKLIAKNKYYETMVKEVQDFIAWLEKPYKDMIIDKYVKNINDNDLGDKYGYSARHLRNIMNKQIENYVEREN